jgi:RNA polymerase sporulation-specific sigma factor
MEQHEVGFGLYAKICIANALISQLRVLKKRKAERLSETSDDGLFVNDSEDPSLKILEQESLSSLYSVIRGNLSDLEYRIWQLYMSGRTAKEIANVIDKDERSVNNAVYRIRKKLRAKLR